MNLLINASAAKYGGAKTVVENYLRNGDFSNYKNVYFIGPKSVDVASRKVQHIELETTGFKTWIFSILLIIKYAIQLRADTLVSFNNVNLIFPICKRKIYFHNLHIFYYKSRKYDLLRFTIKHLLSGSYFVFQTNYVRDEFVKVFGHNYSLYVNWCGCEKVDMVRNKGNKNSKRLKAIVPILDNSMDVKNFKFVHQYKYTLRTLGIEVLSLGKGVDCDQFKYLGIQCKESLYQLYNDCDFMIMPSLFETVGLPIFEFATTGKPVLVLNRPYVEGIDETIGLTSNIIPFEEEVFEQTLETLVKDYDSFCVEPLENGHRLVEPNWTALG